jgi:translation initiation factor 2B subunit (eIF-2B alpha/beta/delta family)
VGGVQLIQQIFAKAHKRGKKFNVIVADMGPDFEGREFV